MGDYVWIPFVAVYVCFSTWCATKARSRGRQRWVTMVGRRPRDLFADQRVNFIANAIEEWLWIGLIVAVLGGVVWMADGPFAAVLWYLGLAMILIRGAVTPYLLANAELDPKYEIETLAPSA